MLGPQAFQDGDDAVLATLRHELKHAEHDRTLLGLADEMARRRARND